MKITFLFLFLLMLSCSPKKSAESDLTDSKKLDSTVLTIGENPFQHDFPEELDSTIVSKLDSIYGKSNYEIIDIFVNHPEYHEVEHHEDTTFKAAEYVETKEYFATVYINDSEKLEHKWNFLISNEWKVSLFVLDGKKVIQ